VDIHLVFDSDRIQFE